MTTASKKTSGIVSLRQWMDAYRESVGDSAEGCSELLEMLLARPLKRGADQLSMLSLLETISALSPDPHTLSCAMIYATEEMGGDCQEARQNLPAVVVSQLKQLQRLQAFVAT